MRTAVLVGVLSAVVASLVSTVVVLGVERARTATATSSTPGTAGLDIEHLLQSTQPSVVSIRTDETTTTGAYGGAGSGVVISDDGLVLTNAHVVSRAERMEVTFSDGTVRPAELVGAFPDDDVALVRVPGVTGLTPARLGRSADVRVGEPVVAIGNALNLGGTPSVTEGIVSAKNRTIEARGLTLRNLLQTDAAINEGNSGGPLLNARGEVIGINTAIISDAQNIGFAISMDEIAPLIDDLKQGRGTITPDTAFLGVATVAMADVNAATRQEFGVTAKRGAFVSDLVQESAAAQAGLEAGDVIVAIDGNAVTAPADVGAVVRGKKPGEQIEISYERRGRKQTATATLRARGNR